MRKFDIVSFGILGVFAIVAAPIVYNDIDYAINGDPAENWGGLMTAVILLVVWSLIGAMLLTRGFIFRGKRMFLIGAFMLMLPSLFLVVTFGLAGTIHDRLLYPPLFLALIAGVVLSLKYRLNK